MNNNEIIKEITSKIDFIYTAIESINVYTKDIVFVVDKILLEIKEINNELLIDEKFNTLQNIFFQLEKVIWNDSYNFPKRLIIYAKDFDRVDNVEYRKILLKKIKEGYYDGSF